MATKVDGVTAPETEIEFITTPEPASQTFKTNKDCGVNIISVSLTSKIVLQTIYESNF